MEREVYHTLLHMTSSENRIPDGLILSLLPIHNAKCTQQETDELVFHMNLATTLVKHKLALRKKATIHQVTAMLTTSKNVLFPGHNHLLTTGIEDPTL